VLHTLLVVALVAFVAVLVQGTAYVAERWGPRRLYWPVVVVAALLALAGAGRVLVHKETVPTSAVTTRTCESQLTELLGTPVDDAGRACQRQSRAVLLRTVGGTLGAVVVLDLVVVGLGRVRRTPRRGRAAA
jgi:hypothetical protein